MPEHTSPSPRGLIISIIIATALLVGAGATVVAMGSDTPTVEAQSSDTRDSTAPNPLSQVADVVGETVPETTFETFDGGVSTFADYEGQLLVVNFFSSTCAPCLLEMPEFEQVKNAHGDDITFLGMNVADSVESGLAVVEKTGITWDLGRDPTGELLTELGGSGMPMTIIVDPDGTITFQQRGQMSAAELEEAIRTRT